jgi:hypothetical protein
MEIRNKTVAIFDLTYLVKCTETSHIIFDCFEGQVTTFQLFSQCAKGFRTTGRAIDGKY